MADGEFVLLIVGVSILLSGVDVYLWLRERNRAWKILDALYQAQMDAWARTYM